MGRVSVRSPREKSAVDGGVGECVCVYLAKEAILFRMCVGELFNFLRRISGMRCFVVVEYSRFDGGGGLVAGYVLRGASSDVSARNYPAVRGARVALASKIEENSIGKMAGF